MAPKPYNNGMKRRSGPKGPDGKRRLISNFSKALGLEQPEKPQGATKGSSRSKKTTKSIRSTRSSPRAADNRVPETPTLGSQAPSVAQVGEDVIMAGSLFEDLPALSPYPWYGAHASAQTTPATSQASQSHPLHEPHQQYRVVRWPVRDRTDSGYYTGGYASPPLFRLAPVPAQAIWDNGLVNAAPAQAAQELTFEEMLDEDKEVDENGHIKGMDFLGNYSGQA